jgi:hypothetical protein
MTKVFREGSSAMDEGDELGWTTTLGLLFVATLSLFICLVNLSRIVQDGPEVGEILVFQPRAAPRDWPSSVIVAGRAAANPPVADQMSLCVLSPAAITRGSLIIEAKETTQPPLYRVHWSGSRTDFGSRDCGTSVDLTIPLASLRILANSAGGFGVRGMNWLF